MNAQNIFRPTTRGELVESLKNNIPCEVVATNEEITSILIVGWLNFTEFKTRPSDNFGWVVYEQDIK